MKIQSLDRNSLLLFLFFLINLPVILAAEKTQEGGESFPKCQEDGDLFACVKQVCEHVQDTMIPLNRPENTIYELDAQGGLQFLDKMPKDPVKPGGGFARAFINRINHENQERIKTSQRTLETRLEQHGLVSSPENKKIYDFLISLNFLVHQARVANCGGMAAVVAGKLLEQPLLQNGTNEAIVIKAGINKKTKLSHAFVESFPNSIVCDAWRPKAHQASVLHCSAQSKTKDPKCRVYNPEFWDVKHGAVLKWPNTSHLKLKERQFFRQEARKLLTEINKQRREGEIAYTAFIEQHKKDLDEMREEEITQPRF